MSGTLAAGEAWGEAPMVIDSFAIILHMTDRQKKYIMQLLPSLSTAEAGRLIGHLQAMENFKRKLGGRPHNIVKFKQTSLI